MGGGLGGANQHSLLIANKDDVLRWMMKCVLSWVGWGGAGIMMFVVACKQR